MLAQPRTLTIANAPADFDGVDSDYDEPTAPPPVEAGAVYVTTTVHGRVLAFGFVDGGWEVAAGWDSSDGQWLIEWIDDTAVLDVEVT